MAKAAVLESVDTGTDLIEAVTANPCIVLLDAEKFDQFYERMKAETDRLVADTSTAKGRDDIRSMARRVVTTKTTIDKARLTLTKQWRDQVDQANAAGKIITSRLDDLAADVRRPLTEWEEAERERANECARIIGSFKSDAIVTDEDTSETVQTRGKAIWATVIDPDRFGDMLPEAEEAKTQAVKVLHAAMLRLKKAEDDAAELARLRAAEEDRLAKEAEEREAKERAEAKRNYARNIISYIKDEVGKGTIGGKAYPYLILVRELEEKISVTEEEFGDMAFDVEAARRETLDHVLAAQKEQAERSRREAAEEAAREAREEEQRKANAEQDRKDARAQAEIDAANRRAAEAERLAQVERDRVAAKEEADRAEAARIAEQARKDHANKALQRRLKTEAKEAIMSCGVSEDAAQKIVLAVRAGEIPHLRWSAPVEQEG